MSKTVGEMSPAELRDLLEEIIDEKLVEMFGDPDEGLELRPELVRRLERQCAAVAAGELGRPLDEVLTDLRRR